MSVVTPVFCQNWDPVTLRQPETANGKPNTFFHLSGIPPQSDGLSIHMYRNLKETNGGVLSLFLYSVRILLYRQSHSSVKILW